MKKPLLVLTLAFASFLVGSIALPAQAVSYTNVLVNPGFATGDLTGWTDVSQSCGGSNLPPFVEVTSTDTTSPPPSGFPYSVETTGCMGLVEQTFSPIIPAQMSFWAEALGTGGCIDAFIVYSGGPANPATSGATPALEVCNISPSGLTSLTPWTQYFLTPNPGEEVVGIEVGHIYGGIGGGFWTDFEVLVPQSSPVPQFPAGLLAVLAITLPAVLALRARYPARPVT